MWAQQPNWKIRCKVTLFSPNRRAEEKRRASFSERKVFFLQNEGHRFATGLRNGEMRVANEGLLPAFAVKRHSQLSSHASLRQY